MGGEVRSWLHVLLVEDIEPAISSLQDGLLDAGHRVSRSKLCTTEFLTLIGRSPSQHPDIVLLHTNKPLCSDARGESDQALASLLDAIKSNPKLAAVPILLSAPTLLQESLQRLVSRGIDDYMAAPCSSFLLRKKLDMYLELQNLRQRLQLQKLRIEENELHLQQEQSVAKAVFDNVLHSGCLDSENIKYMLSSLAMFNGDVLLAALKPSGGMHVFLGDFTGHGLPAAVGALPLAELFYYLSAKGYTISDIIAEMNMKLKSVLPTGVFCCGCMVDVSFEKQMIKVWSGGIPDCYLYHSNSGEVEILSSDHLPLGILDSTAFQSDVQVVEMNRGDRLLICSDGVSEAVNSDGEMFGDARVRQLVEGNQSAEGGPEQLFERVKKSVHQFMGTTDREDDMTMVEVLMVGDFELQNMHAGVTRARPGGPKDWTMTYELGPETLKNFNPLPLMLHIVMEVPGLRPYNGQVYTILAELFSNGLEHGVLNLSSELKSTAAGFMEYYERRAEKLAQLQQGFLRASLTHTPTEYGGALQISVEDSGLGFNVEEVLSHPNRRSGYCGRGIPMVDSLCDSLEFNAQGNRAEACYVWHFE